jgi:hypothetical protein
MNMMVIRIRFVVMALLSLACGACAWLPFVSQDVGITYIELGERAAKRFPIERSVAGLVQIKLLQPRVNGAANRLQLSLDTEISLPQISGSAEGKARSFWGTMSISGVPRFDRATQSMFLDDARLDRLRVDNVPDAVSAAVGRLASQLAREYWTDRPIYVLSDAQRERLRRHMGEGDAVIAVQPGRLALQRK